MNFLIIEDSPVEVKLLTRTLEKVVPELGEIHHAESLTEAEQFLKTTETQIDLVFLDLGLPDSSDWQDTFTRMKPYASRFPVIVMTSNQNPKAIEALLKQGVEDYIIKGSKKLAHDLMADTIKFARLRHEMTHYLHGLVEEQNKCMNWMTGSYSATS